MPSRKVLVAEDAPVNQKLILRMLEKMGHEATLAINGKAAVEAVKTGRFDLVLMDVQMPELDGFQAAKLIRRWEQNKGTRTPIVAMTAHALKGDREKCIAAGMDDYISKPINRDQFSALLQRHLPAGLCGEAEPRIPSPEKMPIIDRSVLLKATNNDETLVQELYSLFLRGLPETLDRMRKAVDDGDIQEIKKRTHCLKGTSASVGAAELCHEAKALEESAFTNDWNRTKDAFSKLEAAVNRLTAESISILEEQSG
jgi:CheY-like chemotaxis protein/HPt (histidine-containing phosphotransfer) domain-containing protein